MFHLDKKRVFSLYDIEEFLKDAGAERITERAIISLERELQDTVRVLINEAAFYANYAGRKRLINSSDVALVNNVGAEKMGMVRKNLKSRPKKRISSLRKSSAMRERG